MAEQWYYQAFGQDFGPLSLDELAQMLHEGELAGEDLVREGTRGAWNAAAGFKVLTEKANSIALETAEVATDIDSFLLLDEKNDSPSGSESDAFADINAFEFDDNEKPAPKHEKPGSRTERPSPKTDTREVWYFQSLGQEFGPVPFTELLEMASRGEVDPE
ncbi:MAG: hypothetical protein JWM11_4449, partial [Planctomycetaceae bacterium]|nr:hypothetical protein [Planctomycetaceae bacterium]